MKMRQIASAAALLAAAAGGGYVAKDPGAVGMHDEVVVEKIAAPPAEVPPVPTATPAEVAGCQHEILIQRAAVAFDDIFGDPLSGYTIVQSGQPAIEIPPGAIDARVVDLVHAYHKAGSQVLRANVEVALYDGGDGHLKDFRELPNLIVDGGRDLGIRMLVGDNTGSCPSVACGNSGACANPVKFNYVGIGSSGTTEAGSQSTLVSEFTIGANYSRQQDTSPDFPGTAGQAKLIVSFGADNPNGDNTIQESALFNASSGGTMLARRKFGTVTKADQDTLQITWTVTLS